MKIILLAIVSTTFVLVAIGFGITVEVAAQKPRAKVAAKPAKAILLRSTPGEAGRGSDPNIKQGETLNDANARREAPLAKGGQPARGPGGECRIHIDNSTSWMIKIYIDGAYHGTIDAWDDLFIPLDRQEHIIYTRVEWGMDFRYWGPMSWRCQDGGHRF